LIEEKNKPKNLLRNLKNEFKKLDSKLNVSQYTHEADNTMNNSRLLTRIPTGQTRGNFDSPMKVTKTNLEVTRRKGTMVDIPGTEPRRRKGTFDSIDEEPKPKVRNNTTERNKRKSSNVFLIEGQENSVVNKTQVNNTVANMTARLPTTIAAVNTAMTTVQDKENPYDNILHYKAYFKKHYMESAVNFQISKALKEKVNTFGKSIKVAISDIQNKSLKITETDSLKP